MTPQVDVAGRQIARKTSASTGTFFDEASKPAPERYAGKRLTFPKAIFLTAALITAVLLFQKPAFSSPKVSPKLSPKPPICSSSAAFRDEAKFRDFLKSCTEKIDWKKILSGVRLAVVGDGVHSENAPQVHIASMMGLFKKMGVTHIALEAFEQNAQPLLDKYAQTGEGREQIEKHLRENTRCPEVTEDMMRIIDEARKYGIKIVCITMNRTVVDGLKKNRSRDERDNYTAEVIAGLLADPKNKVIAVFGPGHAGGTLPAKVAGSAKGQGISPFKTVIIQIIGAEPEPYRYLEGEEFKFERVIREGGMGNSPFMFTMPGAPLSVSEFTIHLLQTEPFTPYGSRCKSP